MMDSRVVDIRISEEADRDLHALRRHCRIVKTGALFLHLVDLGIRPPASSMARQHVTRRARLTIHSRMAGDVASIARSFGVSNEAYLDAFIRHAAATLIHGSRTCPTKSAGPNSTIASTSAATTTRPIAHGTHTQGTRTDRVRVEG